MGFSRSLEPADDISIVQANREQEALSWDGHRHRITTYSSPVEPIMSRFHLVSLLAVVGAAVGLPLSGDAMRWNLAALLVVAYATLFGLGVAFIRLQFFGPNICRGPAAWKLCALTFDDGPDASATEPLLALLRRERVQASFFCIGARVLEFPLLAAGIAADGHLLANHTHRHRWWTNFLSPAALHEEILRAQDAIRSATGITPRYFRPPVGLTNPGLPRVLRRLGLACVGWDVRSLDRVPISADRVARRIRRGLRGGSIVLLHDGGVDPQRLLVIVERVIAFARNEGYRFVRLDQLLGHDVAVTGNSRGADARDA